MVQRVQKADVLAGKTHPLDQWRPRTRLAGKIRAIVDHRDLRGRSGGILDGVLLEQVHEPLPKTVLRLL
jgi:hypothetical protein